MSRSRAIAMAVVALAVLAVLASAVPAPAHTAAPVAAPSLPAPDLLPAPPAPATAAGPEAVAAPGHSPWLLATAVLLCLTVGIGAARRRPRRALVVALVLLLALFAFENALHSVHHGFDAKQYDECSIAAAAANLSVVSVDGVLETSVILIATDRTVDPDPVSPTTRLLEPDQGRAPPAPTA